MQHEVNFIYYKNGFLLGEFLKSFLKSSSGTLFLTHTDFKRQVWENLFKEEVRDKLVITDNIYKFLDEKNNDQDFYHVIIDDLFTFLKYQDILKKDSCLQILKVYGFSPNILILANENNKEKLNQYQINTYWNIIHNLNFKVNSFRLELTKDYFSPKYIEIYPIMTKKMMRSYCSIKEGRFKLIKKVDIERKVNLNNITEMMIDADFFDLLFPFYHLPKDFKLFKRVWVTSSNHFSFLRVIKTLFHFVRINLFLYCFQKNR